MKRGAGHKSQYSLETLSIVEGRLQNQQLFASVTELALVESELKEQTHFSRPQAESFHKT